MGQDRTKNTLILMLLILLAIATIYSVKLGRDVDLTVSAKSGVTFSARKGQTLTELIGDGLNALADVDGDTEGERLEKKNGRKAMNAFLASRDYYRLKGPRLSNAIRDMESDSDAAERLRNVLYDLAGPFSRPDTFRDADARLWGAFEDLHPGLGTEDTDKGALFAEVYTQMLDADSVLGALNNQINAVVSVVSGDKNNPRAIYTCPGSALNQGVFATIRGDMQKGGWMDSILIQSFPHFSCGKPVSPQDFLSGKQIQLGVSQSAFDEIFPSQVAELKEIRSARKGPAKIVVYPANLGPRVLISAAE